MHRSLSLFRILSTGLVALATGCFLPAARAADLVNDTFSDTDRIGGTDGSTSTSSAPVVSTPTATNTQWVANRVKQLVASATGMQWTFDTTSNVQAQGYFPSVTVGSAPVTLTLNFTTGASGATANNLRIALVDDTANGRRTTDGFSSTDPTTVGDVGYALFSSSSNVGGGSTTNLSLGTFKRVTTSSNGLLGTAGDWGSALASSSGATGYFQPNTAYSLQLTLTNTTGSLSVRTVLTGGNFTGLDYTATDAASPVLTFNSLAVRFGTGSNQFSGIRFTGLRVTTGDISLPPAPTITTQPAGQTVIAGSNAVFTVAATGTPGYQWRRNSVALANGGRISGATTATLTVTGALAADAGDYSVVVANTGGSVTSDAATLTVQVPPVVTTPPASQSVVAGADVSFTVAATGTAPLNYQWRRNGSDLTGANLPTLSLTGVTLADAGDYTVFISNVAGSTTSAAATLAVSAAVVPPAIVTPPAAQTVSLGGSASFSVVATGSAPLAYQWSKDGTPLPGATSATLSIAAVTALDAGSYTVAVSNTANTVVSDPAVLTVNLPPTITTSPAGATVNIGDAVSFTVGVTGTAPFTYQWKKNGGVLAGATASSYDLASVSAADAGSYTVAVTNGVGTATSGAAILAVNTPPSIATQPAAQLTVAGGNATFTVVAAGTAPLTYQWSKDGSSLAGATSASLALAGVTAANAGSYTLTVTNAFGTATSIPATLTLTAALPNSAFNLTGFATAGAGTSGGGVIPETDAAYRKVTTPLEFVQAVADSNKTAGLVKVIEIMNDLNLGWNEVGATVQALASNPLRSHATPKLHPTLIASGVSVLDIKAKSGLTIFSANGSTIKHVNFNVKGTSNIMIRNLKFDEMWEWDESSKGNYDDNDWDFITLSNGGAATNVWIDHCTFTKAYDGITDLKAGTQYVTMSWCRYVGDDGATNSNSPVRLQLAALEANKPAYPFYNFLRTNGFSLEDIVTIIQGHDKGHLLGSNSLDAGNNTLSATFHHQWFQNLWDRCVPRLRGGNVHDYNIYVDDVGVLAAKRLRDTRANALSTSLRNTLNNTYSFNPPINGSISTEGGALLLEKSVYADCLWPLRNNQTDITNAAYTGKIQALDSIYSFHNTDGTTTVVRGNSTDAGNPMGPFQAAIIPFSWSNLPGGVLPYTYTLDDPAQLGDILAIGAGAGKVTWAKVNWLRTSYVDDVPPTIAVQPVPQSVIVGNSATFSVTASGTPTLTYQWRKDGNPISGATGTSFTINSPLVTDAGIYDVVVTNSVASTPSAGAALTVSPAAAGVVIGTPTNPVVRMVYDSTPRTPPITTSPGGLTVVTTYDGSLTPPALPGTYHVVTTVNDPNYTGTTEGTLVVRTTVLVRHAPAIVSMLDGSVQLLSAESVTLGGTATITTDLLVPGTPGVTVNGSALLAGTHDGPGNANPTGYSVTLNTNAVLRYLVRRVDPQTMPVVTAPPLPTGTRTVTLTAAGQSAGDFATLRNLAVTGSAGLAAVPPGTYGNLISIGNTGFIFGVPGATEPAVYNLQTLGFNAPTGGSTIQIVGPVIINLGSGFSINGTVGTAGHPEWLDLRIAVGGLVLTGNTVFHGNVTAPNGPVTLNNTAVLNGTVVSDKLNLNGTSVLNDPEQ